ncbi:MAG: GNAT family N-acetyltransferase [Myxococcales bacterium]|nr:GNAT family N-acetyltransferase [Myxococcales bacterium]
MSEPFRCEEFSHPLGRLREFAPDDAGYLAIRLSAMDPWKTLGSEPAGLENYLRRPDAALRRFTVEIDDRPCAVLAVRYPWLRGSFLEILAVSEGWHGQGIGGALLAWLEKQAARLAPNLWVTVSSFNEPALAFYRARGYADAAVLPGLLRPEFDEILLRKGLGEPPCSCGHSH